MSGSVICRPVADAAELAAHHAVRRTVFVDEQRIFVDTDVDAHDARPDTVHVLAWSGSLVVGAVRLFPLDTGRWQGDRLAVLAAHRALGAGGPLVRFAVGEAAARGGSRMLAHVQPPNQRFFERLGWTPAGTEIYAGRPHVTMEIALAPVVTLVAGSGSARPAGLG